jgi:hypothetical protein
LARNPNWLTANLDVITAIWLCNRSGRVLSTLSGNVSLELSGSCGEIQFSFGPIDKFLKSRTAAYNFKRDQKKLINRL